MSDFFGIHSPFIEHCSIVAVEREPGIARARVELTPPLLNAAGNGHGGLLMTLFDVTLAAAARGTHPNSAGVATVDLNVSFLEPANGVLECEGRVLRAGSSLVFCEGEIRNAAGELIAKAMGTFKLMAPRTPGQIGGD
ncbi:PaaI family thioesterase [Pseudogulbenkiania sp. MAI-1]|uniref:PaaI family thioesterase n=1 Tax=Pseudogulbenkiania sp. MAI-1 TaxID=990370 RepID=UPI00045E8E59|nr:PaaI family thioesterase [Pseudogulbenkiania sp. MAI-1]